MIGDDMSWLGDMPPNDDRWGPAQGDEVPRGTKPNGHDKNAGPGVDDDIDDKPQESEHLATVRASILADLEAGAEAIDAAQPPKFIVDQLLPVAGANLCGAGGVSKTTTVLNEMIHITNGSQLYGRDVIQQGVCVLVTAEDGAPYARYVLQQIILDGVDCGLLHPQHAKDAKDMIKVVSWPRAAFGAFANADNYGSVSRSAAFDLMLELLEKYQPAYIAGDPAALLGAGERHGNDGDSFLASMVHEAALKLSCCFQLVDHVSQNVARMGTVDQHAARGGTAKTDNARLARQLVKYKPGNDDVDTAPPSVTPDDLKHGRILQLHTTKSNYAPLPGIAWLRRRRYWMEHLQGGPGVDFDEQRSARVDEQVASDMLAVVACVRETRDQGGMWSQRQYEDATIKDANGAKLSRGRLRSGMAKAFLVGHLVMTDLPITERRGARQQFVDIKGLA